MLLYAGANVGATTRLGGYTPLHLAAQVGNAEVIAPLIAAGAKVNATTCDGRHRADAGRATRAAPKRSASLIENTADPNAKDTANGETALMFAAASDRVETSQAADRRDGAAFKVTDLSRRRPRNSCGTRSSMTRTRAAVTAPSRRPRAGQRRQRRRRRHAAIVTTN